MGLAEIRTEIKNILLSIDGIGIVHDYYRWSVDWKSFLELFKANGYIKGWMITRESTREERETMPQSRRIHTFKIWGVMGHNDAQATEKTFQDLVESICDTFRSNNTLNGQAFDSDPIQVTLIENRMFGKVLAHVAELTLNVLERKIYA